MTPAGVEGIAGQPAYVLVMITGLMLMFLLAAQLVLASLSRGDVRPDWSPGWLEAHRVLGLVLIVLVWLHPLGYGLAVVQRAGRQAPAALLGSLTDGSYYGVSLLLGLAGGIVITLLAVWQLRSGRGRRAHPWIRLGVGLGLWHALRIGSHVREGAIGVLLRLLLALLVAEGVVRLWRSLLPWRRRMRHGKAT